MAPKKKPQPEKLTKLQRFGLFFFGHRETTITFWVALVVFGIACYTTLMQRQGFPNVDVPISVVSGTYFVNDKEKVDSQVADPATKIVKALSVVKKVATTSGSNYFFLTVEYNDGTNSASGNALVSKALTASNVLPPAAHVEFKAIDAGRFAEQSDLLLSISSVNPLSAEQLQARAEAVQAKMKELDGVQNATVLKQVEQGADPVTGETLSEQRTFDRVRGHRERVRVNDIDTPRLLR